MQLIIYPFIVCVGIFLIQLFFIIRKNKIVYNDIQKKDKKHWKLVIKILVALDNINNCRSFILLHIRHICFNRLKCRTLKDLYKLQVIG